MPTQHFTVIGRLPGLNELIAAAKLRYRGKNVAYGKLKAEYEQQVFWAIKQAKVKRIVRPVFITFVWVETNRRRDPDNIAAGGRKIILDALVQAGVLKNDGWSQIGGWRDQFRIAKNANISVTLEEET
jgi:Holliday junction resolvase RusA-like endonuclease